MKKMSCFQMGGPCDVAFTANTPEEMARKGSDHAKSMADDGHKKVADMIKDRSREDNEQWMMDFQKIFDAAPTI